MRSAIGKHVTRYHLFMVELSATKPAHPPRLLGAEGGGTLVGLKNKTYLKDG